VLTGTRSWAGNFASTSFRGNARIGATWGTSQSALARALDPGPRPSYLTVAAGAVLVWSVVGFIIVPALSGPAASIAALAAFVFVPFALWRRAAARRAWAARSSALAGAWVCRKCGSTWTPDLA
jgi:hypothetical protein